MERFGVFRELIEKIIHEVNNNNLILFEGLENLPIKEIEQEENFDWFDEDQRDIDFGGINGY